MNGNREERDDEQEITRDLAGEVYRKIEKILNKKIANKQGIKKLKSIKKVHMMVFKKLWKIMCEEAWNKYGEITWDELFSDLTLLVKRGMVKDGWDASMTLLAWKDLWTRFRSVWEKAEEDPGLWTKILARLNAELDEMI